MLQASEKGWGAAAHTVKAIAEQRGWVHERHGDLSGVVRAIVADSGQPRFMDLFHIANGLHANFYEGWLGQDDVERGLGQVEELLGLLEGALSNG